MTALAAADAGGNARSHGRSTDVECGGRERRRVDVRTFPRTRRRQDGPLASATGDRVQARALVNAYIRAHAQPGPRRPEQLKVAIIGAGATGVELAMSCTTRHARWCPTVSIASMPTRTCS